MPLAYPRGPSPSTGRAGGLGRLRREPPGDGPGGGSRCPGPTAGPLSNDLRRVAPGRAQYTHLLDERRLGGRRHHRMVALRGCLRRHAQCLQHRPGGGGHRGRRHHLSRAVIAVQGPRGPDPTGRRGSGGRRGGPVSVAPFVWEGVACLAAGTGYTGEDGVELAVPVDAAEALWSTLLAAGVLPAGLGARDTLRLEAALPLHGHELGPGITPLQAGLGWVVGWDKDHFRGRDALVAERQDGVPRRLVGLATEGRQPPRQGGALIYDGGPVGAVDQWQFLAHVGSRDRAGFRRHLGGRPTGDWHRPGHRTAGTGARGPGGGNAVRPCRPVGLDPMRNGVHRHWAPRCHVR